MSDRTVALHLHCYQPPRENPWLSVVLREASATPYHDWNERITAECYRPQTAARVLDAAGLLETARNLYASCSSNVGPTLHRWPASDAPDVADAMRRADADACAGHAGHGTAIGQPYVHAILPLADDRDRRTLVGWGVADFVARFGRGPEGMWLPETAVDVATLETLADAGIGYTIVAPQQVARVREPGGDWVEVDGDAVDPTRPYLVRLPSGRSVTVCVFHGPLSRAVAFDRALLSDGDALGRAVLDGFVDRDGPQLLLVATDGETYGHHHRHGEMALARAVATIEDDPTAQLATPGAFLDRHPADHEAELVEPSAWSCPHGVGRWSRDCGCSTSGQPGWNQAWRAPLRAAVDWLRDAVSPPWEEVAGRWFVDPWAARDDYVAVLLDPGAESRGRFLGRHLRPDAAVGDPVVWQLLELQRHLLTTGTSCAWFFADPASLETAVVLSHAACVVDLARAVLGLDLERDLVGRLAGMHSNRPEQGGGAAIWQTWARGAQLDDVDVAASWTALALASGDRPAGRLLGRDVVAYGSATESLDLTVTDPATGLASALRCLGWWGDDGGPHVVVGPDAQPRSVSALPDDVVAELLRGCLDRDVADRPLDAVLLAAAERGLEAQGLAADDAETAVLAAAAVAEADPGRLPLLDAWVALTRALPVDRGRFAAQNLVLALRERLPEWEADPARSGSVDALTRLAGRLGVSLAP